MRNSKFEMHFAQQSCVCFFKIKTGITVSLEYAKFWNLSTFSQKNFKRLTDVNSSSKKYMRKSVLTNFCSLILGRNSANSSIPGTENYSTFAFQGQKITPQWNSRGWKSPDIFIPGAGMSKLAKQAGVSFGSKKFGSKQLWWLRCHPSFYFQQELPP